MIYPFRHLPFLVAAVFLAAGLARAQSAKITLDRSDGVYAVGDTVHWTVTWDGGSAPPEARFRLLKGQLTETASGGVAFQDRVARLESTFDAPGSILLEVKWQGADGKDARATAGAVAAPERIALSAPRPDDFRAFWAEKLTELRRVPANVRLTGVDIGDASIAYAKLTMDNIRGTTINAQLARPAGGEKLPALLIVQWAGVYPLQRSWVLDRAREGWLVLNVMPHELPIDEPDAFYKEQSNGPLKDYWAIGNDDRETSYYVRMYLSCVRGADYLAGRGDWDGRTLVVMGGSQGGMQALVTAGLHPGITAALAAVPAGCDMLGPIVGRKGGWPQWFDWATGKDAARVHEASRYFDVANFAPDIRCPVLVGVGLRDETCPPEGILAAVNQITAPREIILLPEGGHGDENNSHGAYNTRCYNAWLPALRAGGPAPVDAARTHATARSIAPGPFKPSWESLAAHYQAPDWFRDAKFGIWAHWSAQCVPEEGDWYARHMYIQGHKDYEHAVKTYGHPSKSGFMEIENLWKAERWDPERLMDLYVRAGAKYFVALANHHDNFDAYNSRFHAWNSVNVGPKKDIVGTWATIARARGLRFGVSNHSAHAWHWYQTAYGYDAEGPLAGVRYDAFTLKKEDGKGKWWEGLDPQDLYTGPNMVIPDGLTTPQEHAAWHEKNDRVWNEDPPAMNPRFTETWYLRCQDLIDQYKPDLVYFDNFALPLGQTGLDIAAHFYNASLAWHDGRHEAVLNIKGVSPERRGAVIDDIERGVAESIREAPWQTDTCIGAWHYERRLYDEDKYKTVPQVVRMLADIVSKNGNLLLSVPVRGDGTIDDKEVAFLEGLAAWMSIHGEAIFGTRPWELYGEGPSTEESPEKGHFGGARDVRRKPYTPADIRFTTKAGALYAIVMEQPADGKVLIKSLASGAPHVAARKISQVTLLGATAPLAWTQDGEGLHVALPARLPGAHTLALKIQ